MKFNLVFAALSALFLAGFSACVKTEFDEPPVGGNPITLTPNITIAELKLMHTHPGGYDTITQDLLIGGVVVMDDRSGNYYKTLVIQDASGGIEVKFNDGYLYSQFPIGRTIYIHLKGLLLGDYNGLTQLYGSVIEEGGQLSSFGLTEAQVRAHIEKGALGAPPAPKAIPLSELNNDLISTLIQIQDVEFITADTGKTYADAVTKNSVNRTVEACNGLQVLLRTSGYSNFAATKTPGGKGTITGVLGVYNGDYQLYIRDPSDVSMTGPRCGGATGNEVLMNIADVRALFTGTKTYAPADRKIKGVVISDRVANNLNSQNVYLQDASGGIVVRFDASHTFNLGDEVEVVISDQEISEYKGLLELNNVKLAGATRTATGKFVTPREATIADINANFNAWESTLVHIVNSTISAGASLSGNHTVSDGTGSITLFTTATATFAPNPVPAGAVKLTAIVSDFNGKQILLRNANDIQP